MWITNWITKAADTHSEYAILIAFPRHDGYANAPHFYVYTYFPLLVSFRKDMKKEKTLFSRYVKGCVCSYLYVIIPYFSIFLFLICHKYVKCNYNLFYFAVYILTSRNCCLKFYLWNMTLFFSLSLLPYIYALVNMLELLKPWNLVASFFFSVLEVFFIIHLFGYTVAWCVDFYWWYRMVENI